MNEIKYQLNIALEKLGVSEEEFEEKWNKLENLKNELRLLKNKLRKEKDEEEKRILEEYKVDLDAEIKYLEEEKKSYKKVQELSEKLVMLQTSKALMVGVTLHSYIVAFNLKGPLTDHKFVIVNKEIDMSCSKKEFFDFIEIHKCPINNPIRIYKLREVVMRSYMNKLTGLPSPSKLGESDEYLYCSNFGKFQDFCEEVPEWKDNLFTFKFCIEMAKFYESEERQNVANRMLSEYFDHNVVQEGAMLFQHLPLSRKLWILLVFCKEQKTTISSVTNLLCFLVVIAGSYFSVSGAILSDKAVIDLLTSKSLQLLDQYYEQVDDQSITKTDYPMHPSFPSFPKVTIDHESYNIQINSQTSSYRLWEVKLIGKQGSYGKAYVKAIQNHHYSIDTHKQLAKVEYASKVLATSSILGNWLLVYMECREIENAVKYLHDSEHVYGDLHEENIMVHKLEDNDFDIKLIDFE
ncbi:4818_t:CDS:2 [Funneliformis caledonium]|uniref:4818_t:CDS:1 n=1 Tax=Funneliformis caledonium TaxID=1117310 RepID=A0A9N9A1P0_9GLOM|nr:4818_t:CDS:2 [Funneliformis caledonium]